MSTTTTATLAAVVLLPLALGFAGHAPAAGSNGSPAAISTTLAQLESGEAAAEVSQPAAGGTGSEDSATEDAAIQDVNEFQVMSFDDESGKVTITYMKDGKVHVRVVDLVQEDAESAGQPPATGGGIGMAGGIGAMMGEMAYGSGMGGDYEAIISGNSSSASAPDGIRDYADAPASEQKIADVLRQPTEVEFVDTPLHDALEFLAHQNGIRIMIDEQALTDIGVPTDEPVNLMLQDVQLQSVLNHLLRRLECTTIIRDEALIVTTTEVADEYMVTRVYDISDLAEIEQEQLLKVLQESLPDAAWKEGDGGGTASILNDALVVKQSQSAHRQVVDLLDQLRRHMEQRSQSQTSQSFEFDGAGMRFNLQGMAAPATPQTDTSKSTGLVVATKADAPPRKDLTLQIDADGNAHHDGQSLATGQLQTLLQKEQPTLLVLRVDRWASSAAVSRVIYAAKTAGIPELKFAMRAVDPADEAPATEAPPRETVLKLRIDQDGQSWYAGREVSLDQIEGFKQKQRPATVEMDVDPNAPYEAVSSLIETLKSGGTTPQIRFARPDGDPPPVEEPPAGAGSQSSLPPHWETFNPQRLASLLDDEKPVLVNFTADWCLVCKQNEKQALYTNETADLLKQHGIAALTADYTRADDEIKAWLEKFNTESVPLAVVFPKGEPDHPVVLAGPFTQDKLLSTLTSVVAE